ncbi:MAG: C39 family peptidase [Methanobacteriaceae archaeon]|jgi:predicted double-glycine peptidase
MRKIMAMFLIALIIGVTPAFGVNIGEVTADPMAVTGRGVAAASEITEAVESRQTTGAENETLTANVENTTISDNPMQDATFVTSEPAVSTQNSTMSDDPAPADDQAIDAEVQLLDSVVSENDTTGAENVTTAIPQIDTSGIVMQSTDYSCGPAALATVLQNMGINATEGDLKVLAGTNNETGTSLYSLVRAAQSKGVNAVGMRLSVDDLKRNHIVHVVLNGTPHYSVVREVSENSVRLADPSLGNIVMTREEFNEIYTGHTLVISNSNVQEVNQTATSENKNLTVIPNVQVNQTATSKNLTVIPNVQVNQTATDTSKNLTVISDPNVQEVNQTANNTYTGHALVLTNVQEVNQANNTNTSESKNLTVIPNVQLNQTATNKNLTVIPNVQLIKQLQTRI